MDKKERLMAVLNHQKPDRIPASFWFHFDGEKGRGEACVQAHLDYYRAANPDFIKIMSDGLGYPLSVTIGRAEDWYKVAPLPDDDPFFTETVARCAAINQAVGEECYTFYNFFSPYNIIREREVFTSAYQNSNRNETVKTHMQENPDAVRHAMCVIAGDLARLAERVVHEGGCLGIYQSLQGAEIGHLSESMHADVVRPADLQLIRAINEISPYNILHLCWITWHHQVVASLNFLFQRKVGTLTYPVGLHDSLISPVVAENISKEALVALGINTVYLIIGRHDSPRIALANHHLETLQIQLTESTLAQSLIHLGTVSFLRVYGKVLGTHAHALTLHTLYKGGSDKTRYDWIF